MNSEEGSTDDDGKDSREEAKTCFYISQLLSNSTVCKLFGFYLHFNSYIQTNNFETLTMSKMHIALKVLIGLFALFLYKV